MRNYNYSSISFTNQNYNFNNFYDSMEQTMIKLCSETNLFRCNKIISSFIASSFYGIGTEEDKEIIQDLQTNINNELFNDRELAKLIELENHNIDVSLKYISKYYYYYKKMIGLFAIFLESLSGTLMPTTTAQTRKVKYVNTNNFFVSYAKVKQTIGENLSVFTIKKFQLPINNMMVFYYCYRNYVREDARQKVEQSFDFITELVSDESFLNMIQRKQISSKDSSILNTLKIDLYRVLLKIYSVLNNEHSVYNLNPKIQKKVYLDKTLI